MKVLKTGSSVLLSLFLSLYPQFALAQNNDYGKTKLEHRVSDADINEITRIANFSKNDVPIILIKVFDKDSRWPINDAIIELKDKDKSIRESYYVGKEISYFPYMAIADNGAVFSVALGDERRLNRLEVRCEGYNFYEAEFPLFTLLNHINSPLSKRVPDSLSQNMDFRYDWNNAVVFRANYDNLKEFIDKVSNFDFMNYSYYINGESFYSNYASSVLNKDVPQLLPSYEEFHILIPIEIEMEKTPQKIKIEK